MEILMKDETPVETYPNQSALKSLDLILNRKANFLVACWLTYTCIVLFMFYVVNDKINTFTIGIPLFFIFFLISYKMASFKNKDYYSLPTSKTDLGIHKCVYCGDEKIEISKVLFIKVHRCEQCQEFLYTE
jgi:hypothetical protein